MHGRCLIFRLPKVKRNMLLFFKDNQGAIALAANPLSCARSKHINVTMCHSFFFARCPGFPLRSCSWLFLRPGSS